MRALVAILLAFGVAANAQLVRQAIPTLTLPAELPVATGYTTQNALGALTFTSPINSPQSRTRVTEPGHSS